MALIEYRAVMRRCRAAMGLLDHLREHAKEIRDHAYCETDPLIKARLHQIANNLEAAAAEIKHQ